MVIPLLLIVALLLPPISLVDQRYRRLGTTQVTEEGGVIADPDGTQVIFPPGSVSEPFRANLSSVPRVDFLEGSCGQGPAGRGQGHPVRPLGSQRARTTSWRCAGTTPSASTWVVPIPNDSEPYETLDVYTWESARTSLAVAAAQHHRRRRPGREQRARRAALRDGDADQPAARPRVARPRARRKTCRRTAAACWPKCTRPA